MPLSLSLSLLAASQFLSSSSSPLNFFKALKEKEEREGEVGNEKKTLKRRRGKVEQTETLFSLLCSSLFCSIPAVQVWQILPPSSSFLMRKRKRTSKEVMMTLLNRESGYGASWKGFPTCGSRPKMGRRSPFFGWVRVNMKKQKVFKWVKVQKGWEPLTLLRRGRRQNHARMTWFLSTLQQLRFGLYYHHDHHEGWVMPCLCTRQKRGEQTTQPPFLPSSKLY